jgi:hypothetical protein
LQCEQFEQCYHSTMHSVRNLCTLNTGAVTCAGHGLVTEVVLLDMLSSFEIERGMFAAGHVMKGRACVVQSCLAAVAGVWQMHVDCWNLCYVSLNEPLVCS